MDEEKVVETIETGEKDIQLRPGEKLLQDVLTRIENRDLADAGQLDWDDHSQSYTEWSRQR